MQYKYTINKKRKNNKVDNEAMLCYLFYFNIKVFKFILKATIIILIVWFVMSTIDIVAHNNGPYPVFWLGKHNFYNVLVEVARKLDLIMGWA